MTGVEVDWTGVESIMAAIQNLRDGREVGQLGQADQNVAAVRDYLDSRGVLLLESPETVLAILSVLELILTSLWGAVDAGGLSRDRFSPIAATVLEVADAVVLLLPEEARP